MTNVIVIILLQLCCLTPLPLFPLKWVNFKPPIVGQF